MQRAKKKRTPCSSKGAHAHKRALEDAALASVALSKTHAHKAGKAKINFLLHKLFQIKYGLIPFKNLKKM